MSAVAAEEDNLLAAWRLARANGWLEAAIGSMQGLRIFYSGAAWRRLVNDVVPDFIDPASDGPLAGRENDWSLVTEYRVELARAERNWGEAERLQQICVYWDRQRVQSAFADTPDRLKLSGDLQLLNAIDALGTSLHKLAAIQRDQGNPTCATLREALDLPRPSATSERRRSTRSTFSICTKRLTTCVTLTKPNVCIGRASICFPRTTS